MKPYERNKKISQNADKWLDVRRWRSTARVPRAPPAPRASHATSRTSTRARAPLGELSFAGKVALVFGNEHRGVSEEALRAGRRELRHPHARLRAVAQRLGGGGDLASPTAVERREAERGRHGDLSPAEAAALRERFYVLAVKQRARIAKAEAVSATGRRAGPADSGRR